MEREEYPIEVMSYSGYKYAQTPRSFSLWGRIFEVVEIISASRSLSFIDGKVREHFVVKTKEGEVFELCHDEERDYWLARRRERDEGQEKF